MRPLFIHQEPLDLVIFLCVQIKYILKNEISTFLLLSINMSAHFRGYQSRSLLNSEHTLPSPTSTVLQDPPSHVRSHDQGLV